MKKIFHFSVFRLLVFKLFIFVSIIFLARIVFQIEMLQFYYCLVLLFLFSILWLYIYKKKFISEKIQSFLQISIDSSLEVILIHFSGGLDSPLIFLLILDLFVGAYILSKRGIFILAFYISIFYSIFSTLAYLEVLPDFLIVQKTIIPSPDVYFYYVVYMRVFIFFMMGYLASQLSGRLSSQKVKIKQMENLTEKILFQMGSGLITVDINDDIIYSNQAASQILHFPNEKMLGMKWYELLFDKKELENDFLDQFNVHDELEMKVSSVDGSEIFIGISLSCLVNENNKVSGKTIVFRDLTIFKEMEYLRAEQKKLKTLGELASALAHEIKNPLASICGSLEVLKEAHGFPDLKSQRLVNIIFKESERLSRTLGEFLAFSGEVHLRKERHDVKKLIEESLMVLENHAEVHSEIELKFTFDRNKEYFSYFDENFFKQIILNLVLNGVQSIENNGKVTVKLGHVHRDHQRYISIEVTDTGKGIPENIRKDIFKPFYTTREKGIGLGLNVCEKIAQKHGWRIKFESIPDYGTTFKILIPTLEDED